MDLFQLIWRYLAGPIVADAKNMESATWQGVTAVTGYNPVNTFIWALTASAVIYGVYKAFERYDIDFTTEKVIYSLPFIILGGLLRFIEDTGTVPYPLAIILITPILHFGILGLYTATLALSKKLQGLTELNENMIILYTGSTMLLGPVIFSLNYFIGKNSRTDLLLIAIILPIALTALYRFVVKETELDRPGYHLIVFSQLFGGASSMVAVTQGYSQKQLLTQTFTSVFGVSGVMIAKTLLTGLVIYALLDVEDQQLEGLTVLVLSVVGLATGLRVLLRMLAGI